AKGRSLLAAGLQRINLNIGAIGDEYEAIYGLPFQRTLDNVVRFRELAAGRCHVLVMLVGDREERRRLDAVEAFWRQHGFKHFHRPSSINRWRRPGARRLAVRGRERSGAVQCRSRSTRVASMWGPGAVDVHRI